MSNDILDSDSDSWKARLDAIDTPETPEKDRKPAALPCNGCGIPSAKSPCESCGRYKW